MNYAKYSPYKTRWFTIQDIEKQFLGSCKNAFANHMMTLDYMTSTDEFYLCT